LLQLLNEHTPFLAALTSPLRKVCPICTFSRDNAGRWDYDHRSRTICTGSGTIERELATGNEIPRIVAHRCIIEASKGKHIVQTIESPHSPGDTRNHRAPQRQHCQGHGSNIGCIVGPSKHCPHTWTTTVTCASLQSTKQGSMQKTLCHLRDRT
jgi:hypothetical protein